MKYNISKLQGGGFVSFTPILKQSSTNAVAPSGASAKDETEQASILDQDLYKRLIQDGGLVSDVNVFVNQIQSLEQTPFGYLESGNRSNALRMFSKVNELRQNRENWKNAYDSAKASGGLGEIAVGGNRELYVRDKKGDIKVVGMSEFERNRANYNPMTVAQLLEARSKDEKLAFDTSTFSVAEYSVGTENIYDKINKIVDKMGSITSDKTTYVDTKEISKKISQESGLPEASEEVLQGLTQLRAAIGSGPEGIYKVTSKTITPNIQKAYDYVWNSLTEQEKNKLTANSILSGKKGNPREVVENAISSQASATTEFKPEYQKEMTESGSVSGSTTGGLSAVSPMEILIQGNIPTDKVYEWNLEDTGLKLKSRSYGSEKLMDINGKPLGYAKLSEVDSSPVGVQSDLTKVTFGGKVVGINDKDKIVVDNSDANKVYLPTNDDGTPNLNYLEKVTAAQKEIENIPNITPYQAAQIYTNHGLSVNQNGDLETINLKPFIIITAYTTDQSGVTDNNPFIEELEGDWNPWTGDEESAIENVTKEAFSRTDNKDNKGKQPLGSWYTGGETWYKGMIAYPLKDNASAGVAAQHGNVYNAKMTIPQIKINASGRNLATGNAQILNPIE